MLEQADISAKKRMMARDFLLVTVSLFAIYALIFIFLDPFSLPVRLSDHWMTVRLAEDIAGGNPQVSPYWNLGYPALLALTANISGGYETAEKVISLTCGLFLLLASYFLGRKYLGRYWGIAVLWLVAGTEFFVFNVLGLKDYILFAFLLVSAILSLEWAIKKERRWAFSIAGAILGLSFLDRYIALLIFPIFLLAILVKAKEWGRKLTFVIIFLAGFVLLASPQIAINVWREGNPFYAGNARTIWFALQGSSDWSLLFQHQGEESIISLFFSAPLQMLLEWLKNAVALVQIPLLPIPVFVFGWAGLIYIWFQRKDWQMGIPCAILAFYGALTLLYSYWGKYFIALSPYLAISALALMQKLMPERIGKGKRFPFLAPITIILIIVGIAISFYSVKTDSHYLWEKEAIFEVSEKMSSLGVTDPKTVLSTCYDLYLINAGVADKQFAMVPYDISTIEDLDKYISDNHYHYIIAYHRGWTEGYWQGLTAKLMESDRMPANWEPVYWKSGYQSIIIYQID